MRGRKDEEIPASSIRTSRAYIETAKLRKLSAVQGSVQIVGAASRPDTPRVARISGNTCRVQGRDWVGVIHEWFPLKYYVELPLSCNPK